MVGGLFIMQRHAARASMTKFCHATFVAVATLLLGSALFDAAAQEAEKRDVPSLDIKISTSGYARLRTSTPRTGALAAADYWERVNEDEEEAVEGYAASAEGQRTTSVVSPELDLSKVSPKPAPQTLFFGERPNLTKLAGIPYYQTGPVAEPQIAVGGDLWMATSNWWAGLSLDDGKSMKLLDLGAAGLFRGAPGGMDFCCDQVSAYDAPGKAMILLLQSKQVDGDGNLLRLIYFPTSSVTGSFPGSPIDVRRYDLFSANFAQSASMPDSGVWFDYNAISTSDKYLYVSTNMFDQRSEFVASVVLRIPLSSLRESVSELSAQAIVMKKDEFHAHSWRPAVGNGETMYFGETAFEADNLGFLAWSDSDTVAHWSALPLDPWNPKRRGDGTEADEDKWLARADSRVTAGAKVGSHIVFGWTAGNDKNHPLIHIRFAVVDVSDPSRPVMVSQPQIWNRNLNFAYIAAAPNAHGEVGLIMAFNDRNRGSAGYPGIAAGIGRLGEDGSLGLQVSAVESSAYRPKCFNPSRASWDQSCGKWGDYMGIVALGDQNDNWMGCGHVVTSPATTRESESLKVEVICQKFGLQRQ